MSERPISLSLLSSFFNGEHSQNLALLSDEEFWRYAQELAHTTPSPTLPPRAYLKCTLGEEGYCIFPLTALREVVTTPRSLATLPASPPWMLGITAWRGEPIAVLDLTAYFSQSRAILRPDALLLIATNDYATIGIAAVIVSSIPSLQADAMLPLEQTSTDPSLLPSGIIGLYEDAFVLDIPSFMAAIIQHIDNGKRI